MNEALPRLKDQKRLGRGLAALLGEVKSQNETPADPRTVRTVPIEFLQSNEKNPRRSFDETELDELAASIKEHGVIQPVLVRPRPHLKDAFEIVAGERRWRAAQRAGLHAIPIIVMEVGDREAAEIAIIENVQRADLNPLEEAGAYARLGADYGYSQADIAKVVGKSRSHVANTLRLTNLPEHTLSLVSSGALTAGHARALLAVRDPDKIADRIVAKGLSVRDVERLGAEPETKLDGSRRTRAPLPGDAADLKNRMELSLGVRVDFNIGPKRNELKLQFKSLDQFNVVCEHLLRLSNT